MSSLLGASATCTARDESAGTHPLESVDVTPWEMGSIGLEMCMSAGEYVILTGLQAGAQYTINTCGADLETECLTGVSPTSGSVISCSSDSYLLVYDMEGEPLVGW